CSFTFGLPDENTIHLLKENDVYLIGTATTVQEAKLAEDSKMHAVVVQGSEAGGHRGSFHGELTLEPLNELLIDCVNTVEIPVIAAGGIANKEMLDKALSAGAQAVQIG
ncbi:nitronate monooxygenase, partial [Microvirga sp. 3-52]|nr:nitronate monooxygenase [Microvirga sp. 3-52]